MPGDSGERVVPGARWRHDWGDRGNTLEKTADGLLQIDHEIGPDPEQDLQGQQGFTMIGNLSGMISRYYQNATTTEGEIKGVRMRFTPGYVGDLIPKDYKGSTLPLWQFSIKGSQ